MKILLPCSFIIILVLGSCGETKDSVKPDNRSDSVAIEEEISKNTVFTREEPLEEIPEEIDQGETDAESRSVHDKTGLIFKEHKPQDNQLSNAIDIDDPITNPKPTLEKETLTNITVISPPKEYYDKQKYERLASVWEKYFTLPEKEGQLVYTICNTPIDKKSATKSKMLLIGFAYAAKYAEEGDTICVSMGFTDESVTIFSVPFMDFVAFSKDEIDSQELIRRIGAKSRNPR